MTTRDLHALAATLRQLRHEAATGQCALCDGTSVGFIEGWDLRPVGVCADHARKAIRHGFRAHPDPTAGAQS